MFVCVVSLFCSQLQTCCDDAARNVGRVHAGEYAIVASVILGVYIEGTKHMGPGGPTVHVHIDNPQFSVLLTIQVRLPTDSYKLLCNAV